MALLLLSSNESPEIRERLGIIRPGGFYSDPEFLLELDLKSYSLIFSKDFLNEILRKSPLIYPSIFKFQTTVSFSEKYTLVSICLVIYNLRR